MASLDLSRDTTIPMSNIFRNHAQDTRGWASVTVAEAFAPYVRRHSVTAPNFAAFPSSLERSCGVPRD